MRVVAGYDMEAGQRVARWPLREVLLAFRDRLRTAAAEQHRASVLAWSFLAPYLPKNNRKPPDLPAILRG